MTYKPTHPTPFPSKVQSKVQAMFEHMVGWQIVHPRGDRKTPGRSKAAFIRKTSGLHVHVSTPGESAEVSRNFETIGRQIIGNQVAAVLRRIDLKYFFFLNDSCC